MRSRRDSEPQGEALPGPALEPALATDTVLGAAASPSPLDLADGTTPLLEMDRLDIGTPIADLGTAAVSPP